MSEKGELLIALKKVRLDALNECAHHRHQLECKPLPSWSQEKHDQYHARALERASIVAEWCLIRQRQISPD